MVDAENLFTDKVFENLYRQFRLAYAKKIFSMIKEREGSLSASELLSAEVIFLLERPTVSGFADFLNISSPNAAYKIKNLVEKGYVRRVPSDKDKREFYLEITDKFRNYYTENDTYGAFILEKIKSSLDEQEIKRLDGIMRMLMDKVFCNKEN